MIEVKKTPFNEVMEFLRDYSDEMSKLTKNQRDRVLEIRMRAGQFITLELGGERLYLNTKPDSTELFNLLKGFCNYSLYSYEKQLAEGFITLKGGHRAGFAGTAIIKNGKVENIRDVTSINIRIAKEFIGSAEVLYERLFNDGIEQINGLLIIGRPLSAKTTILRDLIRLISKNYKVSVIDERGEISSKSNGNINFNLGANTDVLDAFPKDIGFITAIRTLSPDFIACGEIGNDDISICINSGVKLITTAHSSNFDEAIKSKTLSKIIESGGISHIALLGSGKEIGRLIEFRNIKKDGLGYENYSGDYSNNSWRVNRIIPSIKA